MTTVFTLRSGLAWEMMWSHILVAHMITIQQLDLQAKSYFTLLVLKDLLKSWIHNVRNSWNKIWNSNSNVLCSVYGDRMAMGKNLSKSFADSSDLTMKLDANYSELLYLGIKDFKWVLFFGLFHFWIKDNKSIIKIFRWHREQQDEPFIRAFIRDTVKPNFVDSLEFYTIGNINLETTVVTPSLKEVKAFKKYKGDRFTCSKTLQSRLKSMKFGRKK